MSAPPNIFGSFGGTTKPTENKSDALNTGAPNLFGSFGFGSTGNSGSGSTTPSGNPTSSTTGTGFASAAFGGSSIFGAKPATGDQSKPASVFGAGTSGGTNIFGASSSTPNSGTATPSGGSLFGNLNAGSNQTTAAPSSSAPNLFGGATSATQAGGETTKPSIFGSTTGTGGGLFGGASATQTSGNLGTGTAGGTAGGGSLFSGFGKPTPSAEGTATPPITTTAPAPPSSLFGNLSSTTSNPLAGATNSNATSAGNKPPEPPKNLFGGFGTQATTGSTPAPSFNLFGSKPADPPKPAESTVPKPTSLFGAAAPTPPPTGDPEKKTGSTPLPNLFGAKPTTTENKDAQPAAASTTAGGTGGLFGGFGATTKPAEAAADKKDDKPAASAPGTAPTGGLFGGGFGGLPKKPDEPKAPTATIEASKAPAAPSGTAPAATATNATPPSQLRGKSIEEIVSRWEQDLQTNIKEFNRVAQEVSAWDKVLIENGNYIAQLHNQVLAAEASQQLIEQTLSSVEAQQQELSATLEVYEKQAKEILDGSGGALRALETGPADAARDRNYTLAGELSVNFDDLTKSISQMIDSVNELSISSGNEATDKGDPLTQIAEVLNEHLASLTWIDGAIGEMESKVSQVKPRLSQLNGSVANGASTRRAAPGNRAW